MTYSSRDGVAIHASADGALAWEAPLSPRRGLAYARSMGATPEDSALMLRYRDGDMQAFETLYRRHNDALYRYLLRLTLNREAAEDVFQETWGKIVRSRRNYRPTAKFSTFLYRVAHNSFIDYVRRNKRHTGHSELDPERSPDPAEEPAAEVEKRLFRQRLHAALGELPEEQRDVFLLHEEAGLSVDAIASVTGTNRETTKSRLRYAVKKLKTALTVAAEDPAQSPSER